MFDGKIPVKKNSVEAEVMRKGFLLAGLVVVLKTHAFVGKKKSMTTGILDYEKPSGFSCRCPMGFPRSVILTVLWQYAEFSGFFHDPSLWGMYPT